MKKLSVLVLIVSLGACSEQNETIATNQPLSAYSDEEIANEFIERLDAVSSRYDQAYFEDMYSELTKPKDDNENSEDAALSEYEARMKNVREALSPFADAGIESAQAALGSLMMLSSSLETRCDGYVLARDTAIHGGPFSLFAFKGSMWRPFDREADDRADYLLSRELAHRLPSVFAKHHESLKTLLSDEEAEQYEKDWLEWTVEDIPERLTNDCRSE